MCIWYLILELNFEGEQKVHPRSLLLVVLLPPSYNGGPNSGKLNLFFIREWVRYMSSFTFTLYSFWKWLKTIHSVQSYLTIGFRTKPTKIIIIYIFAFIARLLWCGVKITATEMLSSSERRYPAFLVTYTLSASHVMCWSAKSTHSKLFPTLPWSEHWRTRLTHHWKYGGLDAHP